MATTLNDERSHSAGGINFKHLKLTAGGADVTVVYTFAAPFPILTGVYVVKTTGAAGANNITYVEATGVLTVSCGNSDVLRITATY